MDPQQTIIDAEDEENKGTRKSSHTKNPTTCSDTRRSGDACGICGSYNVVNQGVQYCTSCGLEVESLEQDSYFWWVMDSQKPICSCPLIEKKFKNRAHKISPRDSYSIGKCIDCGAVNSSRLCPNCGSGRGYGFRTWRHWDGRIKCQSCGFTIDEATLCSVGATPTGKKAQGKQGTRKAKEAAKTHMSKRKQKRIAAKNKPHPNKIGDKK